MFAPAQKIRGFKTGDDDGAHFRVFKPQTLNGIGEFDIHSQVIRVEFELVAFGERLIFLHVHRKGGDRARQCSVSSVCTDRAMSES